MVRLCDLKWEKRKFWDHTVLPGGVMLWRSNEDNDHWPLHTYQVDGTGLTLGSNMDELTAQCWLVEYMRKRRKHDRSNG
jgi:hypothetical protein